MSNLSLLFLSTTSLTLEKTEWGIENGQSRNMDKTKLNKVKNTTQKTKKLSNTIHNLLDFTLVDTFHYRPSLPLYLPADYISKTRIKVRVS